MTRHAITRSLAPLLLAALGAAALWASTPPAPTPPRSRVEIRLARKAAAPGFAAIPTGPFAGRFFLAEKPLFTNPDFTGARVATTGSGVALLLSFTPPAAKRLEAFTRRSRGKEFALLLEGRPLLVTSVGDPIRGGEMALVAGLSFADAQAVAQALSAPPAPRAAPPQPRRR